MKNIFKYFGSFSIVMLILILIVTNFTTANPIQNVMEFMFEWFLIHRDSRQMEQISPSQADPGDCRVRIDSTGCNAFLEARKPTS